jgi:methyltransferase (TIGR00027 family)
MRDGQPSFTSRMVMFFRALAAHDPGIGIFNDFLAEQLLNARGQRIVRRPRTYRFMARLFRRRPRLKEAFSALLLRARFAEDELARAMETEGVRQYVILGAGWDTFAWRRPDLMARLRVFELDYPATQAAKRDRLSERGLPAPANLTFVPIDFTTQSLSTRLQESGFDPALPTFVNWMGVTYYLPMPVVEGVFRELRALCAGGVAVAFDYMDAQVRELIARQPKTLLRRLRRHIGLRIWRRIGEPFHTLLDASLLAEWLRTLGYELRENLTRETKRNYLPPEEMGSHVPGGWMNIALAHSLAREA